MMKPIAEQLLESSWDVWSTRIMVTVVLLLLWDFVVKPKEEKEAEAEVAVLQYVVPPKEEDVAEDKPVSSRSNNRLLDQLEETANHQKVSPPEAEPQRSEETRESKNVDNPTKRTGEAKKKTIKKNKSAAARPTSQVTASPPPMQATTNHHPGMAGFGHWYEVETSLFRMYTLGRTDGVDVAPPYVPHSYRGTVSVALHVTNRTTSVLNVMWVDYSGKYIKKGTLKPNHTWTQETWIDHPWVFEYADDQSPVLYYIPYRVLPTLPDSSTVADDGMGQFQFAIIPGREADPYHVGVEDAILPFPASVAFADPLPAIVWTLQHMARMNQVTPEDHTLDVVQKYLTNIIDHPETVKYRQLRIASKGFAPIWASTMKGLFLAVGFVEVGAYAELGCATTPLSRERIQDVALLSYMIKDWRDKQKEQEQQLYNMQQPEGADGHGRHGYDRVGH